MNDFRNFSSIDSEKRIELFEKDFFFDTILSSINQNLVEPEKLIFERFKSKHCYPSILILSSPRTGSTFLTQLMASKLKISYVSNLMSKFYNLPLLGAYLQKKLIDVENIKQLKTYKSLHGNTSNIFEPSEFGYFWARHFNVDLDHHEPKDEMLKKIDFKNLNCELNNISRIFNLPVLYKCPIGVFLINQILSETNSFIIILKRNKRDTVKSILQTRTDRFGRNDIWWSTRPRNYKLLIKEKPIKQVQWQYDKIYESLESYDKLKFKKRVIHCDYENLTKFPNEELNNISNAYFRYSSKKIV